MYEEPRTNSLDFLGVLLVKLLHLLPCIDPVDVLVRTGQVLRHGCRPVHKPQVEVGGLELLEGVEESLLGAQVVIVVELGGEEEGFTGNTGSLDAFADLGFVTCTLKRKDDIVSDIEEHNGWMREHTVSSSGVDVLVTSLETDFNGLLDSTGLRLPSACRDRSMGELDSSGHKNGLRTYRDRESASQHRC